MLDRATFLRPVAHRGLHDAAAGRVENSAAAFTAAIERGYGIECDLRPARSNLPVIFTTRRWSGSSMRKVRSPIWGAATCRPCAIARAAKRS